MNWVVINFRLLIQLLLPTFLRKEKQTAFLNSIIKPLDELYKKTLYNMQHTCQVIYLEKLLNEHYAISDYNTNNHENTKVIYIEDAPKPPIKYIYLKEEIPPKSYLYLGRHYLTGTSDYNDFIIFVPSNLMIDEVKLRAIVDYYKLAGKKYLIQFTN